MKLPDDLTLPAAKTQGLLQRNVATVWLKAKVKRKKAKQRGNRSVVSLLAMRRFLIFITLISALTAGVSGQTAREFTGRLDPALSPDLVHVYERVYSGVKDVSAYKLDPRPAAGTTLAVGELIDNRLRGGKTTVVLAEPRSGAPYFWIDANRNGIFEAGERATFTATSETPAWAAMVRLPLVNARYKDYPFYIAFHAGFSHPKIPATSRLIEQSVYALAHGRAKIGEREVLLQYPFAVTVPDISLSDGTFGMDVDGDGRIRNEEFSVESQYAAEEEAIFPLGGLFVSTSKIDMASGAITLRERRREEYTRIDLEVGQEMPDFAFVDLDGKPRKLSEFRGRYLMVDFWGVWCGDCTDETPFHIAAYERFKKRGFEILGVDSDEKIETAKAYLLKHQITWPQANFDSTKDLQRRLYKLQEYPSTILLGPDGKVLVLDQKKLRGNTLLKTLDAILPPGG